MILCLNLGCLVILITIEHMPQVPRKAVINVFYGILEEVEAKLDQLPTVLEIFKIYEYLLVVFLIIRNDILDPETNPSDIFNPGFEVLLWPRRLLAV